MHRTDATMVGYAALLVAAAALLFAAERAGRPAAVTASGTDQPVAEITADPNFWGFP